MSLLTRRRIVKNLPWMAETDPYPLGVVASAQVAELAASLVSAVADQSREGWEEAGGARAQAQALARRAAELGPRGGDAYLAARRALAGRAHVSSAASTAGDQARRNWQLGVAVEHAADAPLELAAIAADIAKLAELIAARAADDVRADAAVAAMLAAAAARAAARLVAINLAVGEKQPAVVARRYAEAATLSAAEVEAADP